MNPKRIVITGGPGTGKTAVIKALEARGFFCFHEIIRTMTSNATKEEESKEFTSNPLAFVSDPFLFNQKLLRGRVAQFHEASNMKRPVVFYDRGIPDVLAYMNYFDQAYDEEFTSACSSHLYDHVLILPPWKEIYISDNERFESFEEGLSIHTALQNMYEECGYTLHTVPKGSVDERTEYILNEVIAKE